MKSSFELSGAGRAYVAIVAVAGITAVVHSIAALSTGRLGFQWFVLAGLTLLSGSFTVRVPTIPARLSVSETFVFAAAILFGPAAATVLVVLDSLVISLWQPRSSRTPQRVLFNTAAPAVAIWVAAHIFFLLAGTAPLHEAPRPILPLLVPLLVLAVVYFLLNSWLIAGAVAFEKRTSALLVWRQNFLWLSLNFFSGASVAALLLPYLQDADQPFFRVAGILLPLLLISYLTYKTALGRVEDANRHLSELNQLYLSTIETLAMAIDAKDQITHGHIRRVQQYAVGLAKLLGITDAAQIKAIEAASLLHDMGKLAVPEYILNKPGKLTPAEFERMKVHASVGADILSAINFPYPVVPIVRHHHENWDGTGYPTGLKASEIPIGARILSVVDCFDALTSDRPYRPRLTDSEAVRILLQRRGSMYDPLVVDAFISAHAEIGRVSASDESGASDRLTTAMTEAATGAPHPLENISASTEEMLFLYDLARALTGRLTPEDVLETVFNHMRRIVPIATCVFYEYDPAADIIIARHSVGEHAGSFVGLRIPRGQRLSGWVAANKQTILNSDPVLDLGEVARAAKPRLRSCLSTPLLSADSLIGVLTAYSVYEEPFGEDDRRVFESVSRQVAEVLRSGMAAGVPPTHVAPNPQPTGTLCNEEDLRQLFAGVDRPGVFSLIYVELQADRSMALPLIESCIHAVSGAVRKQLPNPRLLFRYGATSLVAVLPELDQSVGAHISALIGKDLSTPDSPSELQTVAHIYVGFAGAPNDGFTLDALIAAANRRMKAVDVSSSRPPSVH